MPYIFLLTYNAARRMPSTPIVERERERERERVEAHEVCRRTIDAADGLMVDDAGLGRSGV